MLFKRVLILTMTMLIALSPAVLPAAAADEPYDETEEVEVTVVPTEAPTEPRPSPAELGYAAYAEKLDKTVFDGELGAVYSQKSTTFRLWSPAAEAVKVSIYKTGSDSEAGARLISNNSMKYSKKNGVWELTLKGDYKNFYYTYQVTVQGKTNEVVDPYATAVGVNGNRGMIISLDETDPEDWDKDSFKRVDSIVDAAVWEVNVRDFSADESSGVSENNRGKFLAFTESDTTLNGAGDIATCVAYLSELGVNYVQINPFYDFASIDESDTVSAQYNWGYDPKNYNVPEGSYSSDPYDGRVRIKECKQMIQALHEAGIGVIMDVVYNHTYYSEDSFLNQIAPYYYHRVNEDGSWSNGSGCGNDVATERYMVSRLIRDSVEYWAKEYHIDGFRFDLMGLMDVDTMNGIRERLDKLDDGKRILMFGEAWDLSTAVPSDVKLANQTNMYLLSDRIAAFNDTGRDAIKGSNFDASDGGFVQLGKSKSGVRSSIEADGGGWAKAPSQCVNYVSCHDNLTLYDKLTSSIYGDGKYDLRREELVDMNKLAAAVVMMSRGMPFMLAGEELGRTKQGDENSYISPVEINAINWNHLERFSSLVEYYKGLLYIRSVTGAFSDPSGDKSKLEYLEPSAKGAVAYTVRSDGKPTVAVVLNGSPDETAEVDLPSGEWVIVADRFRAGLDVLGYAKGKLSVPATSAYILIKSGDFGSVGELKSSSRVFVRYIDKSTGSVICETVEKGTIGDRYAIETPDSILFQYDLLGNTSALNGTFTDYSTVIEIECEAYEGDYSFVSFKFFDEYDNRAADTVVMKNRVGQQYYTPYIPGIVGYELDLRRLPENGAGKYTEEPIEVVYYFVRSSEEAVSDSEYSCRANVIYMSDTGEILDTKSYMGIGGDPLEITQLEFEDYDFISVSDEYAAFSEIETNVMVYYAHKKPKTLLYAVIGCMVLTLAGGAAAYIAGRSKRRKMSSIEIIE